MVRAAGEFGTSRGPGRQARGQGLGRETLVLWGARPCIGVPFSSKHLLPFWRISVGVRKVPSPSAL